MPRPYNLLRECAATLITSSLAAGQIGLAAFTSFDIVRINVAFLEHLQSRTFDNIVVSVPLVFIGVIIDFVNRRRRHQIAEHRLHVLQVTMRTVQDTVNNLLNNLQLVRLDAEGVLPDQTVQQLDDLIDQTAVQIRALGNLDEVKEIQMAAGTGIDYRPHPDQGVAAAKL
jgi:hypothetical protein